MDLSILYDSNATINEKSDCFFDKLSILVDTHVPSKRMTPKEIKLWSKPWINFKVHMHRNF